MTVKKVIKPIHGINTEELETDLRFLLQNESETPDQFVEAGIDLVVSYVNEGMEQYQEYLMNELSQYFKGEIAGVILRARRKSVVEDKKPTENTNNDTLDW